MTPLQSLLCSLRRQPVWIRYRDFVESEGAPRLCRGTLLRVEIDHVVLREETADRMIPVFAIRHIGRDSATVPA